MIHPLAGLLSPRRIAIFDSADAAKMWRQHTASNNNLEIIFIDPRVEMTDTISSLQSAPWRPDLAFIAENSRQALVDCSYAGVPAAVVYGDDADISNVSASIRVLHVGAGHFARPNHNIMLRHANLPAGKVALLSNDELVSDALMLQLAQKGIGLSFYASVTPWSDVQLDDLLSLLEQDEQSETIGLYLDEPVKPRMILDVLSRMTSNKPVVALLPIEHCASTWEALLQHAGVTTVHSLDEFGRTILAFNTARHGGSFYRSAHRPIIEQSDNWRYISALRHLAGVDPSRHIIDIGSDNVPVDALDAQHVYIAKQSRPLAIRLTGASAAVHTAWQHAIKPSPQLTDLAKDQLRQELASMPTERPVELPYIQTLLSQAGIKMVDGLWLDENQSLETQIRELGQPINAWLIQGNGQTIRYLHASREKLRRLQRHGERVWVQSASAAGLEVMAKAARHPQFGPIMSCQPALISNQTDKLDYALPLSGRKAEILAERLLPNRVADWESLAATLVAISNLFTSVPELQILNATVICLPDQSRVADATLEWMP